MKNLILRIALATVLGFTVTGAFAQRQRQQNQGNRQQQMAAPLMQNALDALAAESDPLQLVYRKDVQRDLGLDLGQRNKLDNLHDHQVRDVQLTRQQNRRNQAATTDLIAKQRKETQDKVDELFTKEQKVRLNQIVLQLQGAATLLSADVQKQLQITEEQNQRIKQIQADRDQRIKDLQNSVGLGEVRPPEVPRQIQDIQKSTNTALTEVLTADQQEQLKALLGRPFKAG